MMTRMSGTDLAHAQRTLETLRHRVDEGIASVVASDYREEGGDNSVVPSIDAIRCWPEAGWPNQLTEEPMRPVPVDPEDPKNQAPHKAQS